MTDDMMNLRTGGEGPDADLLREMIGFAAERRIEMEVGAANVLAHAGKSGRRVVSAFIATAFAQETAEAASL